MPVEQSLTETIAAEIRAEVARQRRKYSDLAKELGLAPATISDRMAGRVPFDTNELEKVAQWLGIDVVHLISPRYRNAA